MTSQRGFSMIEVLITILIMGFGLLGFAMLQTMSLRYSQNANQRTVATNLATDLLDQMRATRMGASQYVGDYTGGTAGRCTTRQLGALTTTVNVQRWQCQMRDALGTNARAEVRMNGNVVRVDIRWDDPRIPGGSSETRFVTETRL